MGANANLENCIHLFFFFFGGFKHLFWNIWKTKLLIMNYELNNFVVIDGLKCWCLFFALHMVLMMVDEKMGI